MSHKSPVAFYVVAHPDDWFYFMSSCIKDAQDVKSFVIILLTAGDNGKSEWGAARETALKKTAVNLLLINDGYDGPLKAFSEEECECAEGLSMNIIASHKMMVKIISYRFADGNHEGQGFKKTDHQSLRHCFEGGVVQHQILNREIGDHALFSGSPYTFEDVVRSVSDLVSSECRQCDISPAKVWINSTHPTLGEHSDHCMAGRVAARVAQRLGCKVALWADYSDSCHEANLDSYTIVGKGLLLGAYTSAIHACNPLAFGSDGTSSWKWLCYNHMLYCGPGKDFDLNNGRM